MKTKSIIDILEVELCKSVSSITVSDLDKIKKLTINKVNYSGEILPVDSRDLLNFKNLESLDINGCMVDQEFLNNILKLKNLITLNFYNVDFIDGTEDFFDILKVKSLTIDNSLGIQNITFSNYEYLKIKNCNLFNEFININKLDISFCDLSLDNFMIKSVNLLVIDENLKSSISQLHYEYKKLQIINKYDEVIVELNNDY